MTSLTSSVFFKQLYRVLHDGEMGTPWRQAPEVVVPPLNENRTPFGADWQHLSFALNPGVTGEHWRVLYGSATAFMNGSGFDGGTPRADYVNSRDLSAPLPAWDKTRTMGGATVAGVVDGLDLIVEILDGNQPAPSLEWLLARPWLYYRALTVYADGHVSNFPEAVGLPVFVPLVGSGVARVPLSKVQRVPAIANPYVYGYQPTPC